VRIIFEIYCGAYNADYHYHKDNGHRNYGRHGFGAVINAYLHNYRRKIVEKMYQNARPHTARYRNGIAYGNTCDKGERNLNHIAVQKRKDKRRHNNRKPIAVFAKRLHNYAAHCELLYESRQNSGFYDIRQYNGRRCQLYAVLRHGKFYAEEVLKDTSENARRITAGYTRHKSRKNKQEKHGCVFGCSERQNRGQSALGF